MRYLGSKWSAGTYMAIISLMPPHDTYIEPFAGTGAIALTKAPAKHNILIDRDPAAIRSITEHPRVNELPGLELLCVDALEWLEQLDPNDLGRVVIYCDPPYVLSTRTSGKRYRFELAEEDHRRLAKALRGLRAVGCRIIISGYPSGLYDELFAGWNTREFQAMTRGGVRTEKLWFNFDPGFAHQADFAGGGWIRRQNIRRKAARWKAKFEALEAAERQAVLAALLAAEISPS